MAVEADYDTLLLEGLEFRKEGGKQAYQYVEDLTTKPDPRCNHCGKTSYRAETVSYNKIPYHKTCFRCIQCKKKLTPGNANPLGATTYMCNIHFGQVSKGRVGGTTGEAISAESADVKATGPSVVSGGDSDQADYDYDKGNDWRKTVGKQAYRYPEDMEGPDKRNDPRCHSCGKTSYKAETVTYERIPYHKGCFKCQVCKKKLTPGGASPFGEAEFLCNTHFGQALQRGTKAAGEVFSAETTGVEAPAGKSLVTGGSKESVDMSEGMEWRAAGVKQTYNYPEDLDGPAKRNDPRCSKCGKTSYKAETITYERIPYHKNPCFKCVQCKKKLTAGDANPFGNAEFLCNTHFQQVIMGTKGGGASAVSADTSPQEASGGIVTGNSSGTAHTFDLSGGLEWRKIGKKQFYKYPEDMDGPTARHDPRCNLCGKTSYRAETVTYEKIPYHKGCFKCLQCRKKMTPGDANPFGEDEFLCNVHYHQVVFGGGGKSVDDNTISADSAAVTATGPSSVVGTSDSGGLNEKIQEGIAWRARGGKQVYKYPESYENSPDPRCNLCGKKAYRAETVTYEKIPYHKQCFKCLQCKKKLTGGTANPWGDDGYLCNAHFMQLAMGRTGIGADEDVVSATSEPADVAGPSSVGGTTASGRKKTSYKPPKRNR